MEFLKGLIEIRWHGRGGQGVVTAAKMLAESSLSEGKFIQAFPEYGPERMGAPIRSFTRISPTPIIIHSQVRNPQIVVVLDPTLIGSVDICEGLSSDGIILVNTPGSPGQIRDQLKLKKAKVFTVDATAIAIEKFGKNIPNTPMIGALAKVTNLVKIEALVENFQKAYSEKFKPEVIQGNIEAIKTAYEKVREK